MLLNSEKHVKPEAVNAVATPRMPAQLAPLAPQGTLVWMVFQEKTANQEKLDTQETETLFTLPSRDADPARKETTDPLAQSEDPANKELLVALEHQAVAVQMASLDHLDPLDQLDQPELMASQVRKDPLVPQALEVAKDPQAPRVQRVKMEDLDQPVAQDQKVPMANQAPVDPQDHQAHLESQANPDPQERKEHPDPLVPMPNIVLAPRELVVLSLPRSKRSDETTITDDPLNDNCQKFA
jgi:hypothetical protein